MHVFMCFHRCMWRREWQPTPVFLTGEFHGQRSLTGYNPWGHMESDTTEQLTHMHINVCGASQVAQWKRIPPAMQETWIRSLDQEDPLEEDRESDTTKVT